MSERNAGLGEVVDSIVDLTRVTIAMSGRFGSKSEAIRQLNLLAIPPARIATILALPVGDVSSALAKAKKREKATKVDQAETEQ